jgi:uncharacterized DUF497 family protein
VNLKVRWDPFKAEENSRKHGVIFEEAQTIFFDPLFVSVEDTEHSHGEDRRFAIGESIRHRLLALIYTIRSEESWIITARIATRAESRRYMRGDRLRDHGIDQDEHDPSAHLDWSKAVRGLHYIKPRGPITVQIEPVLAEFFRNEEMVNEALRFMICEGHVGMWSADGSTD